MLPSHRARLFIAAAYGGAGAALVGFLFWKTTFPFRWEWLALGLAFGLFQALSVEVNDRLRASPTVMITLTAAVIFGKGSAALGAATIAAFGAITPRDLRERRWFQPIANLGQFVLSGALAGAVIELALPDGPFDVGDIGRVALGSAVGAVLYGAANLGLVTLAVRTVFRRRNLRPWARMRSLVPSLLLMGLLGGLLGAAYQMVGPATLPLILTVFLVGHLGFRSVAQLREAHESTLQGFIKALEAKDLYTRGHTERVAYFSQLTAEEMGFRGDALDRVRIAALIHDIGKLAVPRRLIRKKGPLSESEYRMMQEHARLVEEILHEVEFLAPMVEIASGHHSRFDGGGYGGSGHTQGEPPGLESRILAVADAFDAMTSTRSYRLALSQDYAIAELRRSAGSQLDPDVVEAFVRALAATGEQYGSPSLADEKEARRRAEEVGVA
ncbi:MAG: HD domain-containing phosphohydrolase [Acidimicrobiia bacterium]